MKRIQITLGILLSFFVGAVAAGCSSSKDDIPEDTTPLSVVDQRVADNGITCGKDGSQTYFNVVSGEDVKAASDVAWIEVSVGERTQVNHITRISLDIAPNTTTDTRTGKVTVSTRTQSVTVNVTQGESAGLIVKTVEGTPVDAAGGTVKVTLTSTDNPAVTTSAAWITVQEGRSMTDHTVMLTVAPNLSTSERTATVTFAVADLKETLSITQKAGEASTDGITGTTPAEIALSMGMGWNLGNQMDAFANNVANETCWGNKAATPELFAKLREAGFSTVRIPVTWLGKVGAAPDYTIDAAWLNRVAELVGYAHAVGLNVIINIHHHGDELDIKRAANDASFNAEVKARVSAMWSQIARKFASEGGYLMFESFNEIHDGGWGWGDNRTDGGKQYRTLVEWNQTMVDAVRAAGGENARRWIGVPAYCTNADLSYDSNFKMPVDPAGRTMLALHNYDPVDFTLEDKVSEWGHTGKDVVSWANEKTLGETFSKIKKTWIDKGVPVYLGEIGCVHRSSERSERFRLYYLEYICKLAREYSMSPLYWDNGSAAAGRECSGLFNRSTGAYLNNGADVVAVMVKGYTNNDPNYTISSVYGSAPQ